MRRRVLAAALALLIQAGLTDRTGPDAAADLQQLICRRA